MFAAAQGVRRLPRVRLSLTTPQMDVFNDPARFRVLLAGRRFGKTYLSRAEIVHHAVARPGSLSVYLAPSRVQAKQLMWDSLKALLPPSLVSRKEEVDLKVTLVNGSQILLRGAENEAGLRGLGISFVVLDEAAFMASTVFSDVVRPALSDHRGRALFIATPSPDWNWFHDLAVDIRGRPGWSYREFTTLEGGNVPLDEVDAARSDMDPRTFRREYEAKWESMAGRVYYAFDPRMHAVPLPPLSLDPPDVLHVGIDFNVDPMSAAIGVKRGGQVHVISEVSVRNGNTQMLADTLRARFPSHPIVCYPDPTGASRKTAAAAGDTDHAILRRAGFQVYSPGRAYAVADKLNTVNRAFRDASGNVRLYLDPAHTKVLRKSLEGLSFVEGTSIPDPRSEHSHMTDALAYMVLALLPIIGGMRRVDVIG